MRQRETCKIGSSSREVRIDPPRHESSFFSDSTVSGYSPCSDGGSFRFCCGRLRPKGYPAGRRQNNGILSQMTLDEKVLYVSAVIVNFANPKGAFNFKPMPRLGLREIFGNNSNRYSRSRLSAGHAYPARQLLASHVWQFY
jgi:hypothetical protein